MSPLFSRNNMKVYSETKKAKLIRPRIHPPRCGTGKKSKYSTAILIKRAFDPPYNANVSKVIILIKKTVQKTRADP